jgi:hypothetical protein
MNKTHRFITALSIYKIKIAGLQIKQGRFLFPALKLYPIFPMESKVCISVYR